MTDQQREELIQGYWLVGVNEPDLERRRAALLRMNELVKQRSPAQVERMERKQGLRRV